MYRHAYRKDWDPLQIVLRWWLKVIRICYRLYRKRVCKVLDERNFCLLGHGLEMSRWEIVMVVVNQLQVVECLEYGIGVYFVY